MYVIFSVIKFPVFDYSVIVVMIEFDYPITAHAKCYEDTHHGKYMPEKSSDIMHVTHIKICWVCIRLRSIWFIAQLISA